MTRKVSVSRVCWRCDPPFITNEKRQGDRWWWVANLRLWRHKRAVHRLGYSE